MAYYLTTDESLCGHAPVGLGAFASTTSSTEWAARRAALLQALLRCVSIGAALDTIRDQLDGFLTVTSICWQVDDERYSCNAASLSDHAVAVGLTLDDRPFGRLLVHTRLAIDEVDLAELRQMLAVAAYPLRNLRMLEQALIAAEHDGLTGLKNRRAFDMELHDLHARLSRYDGQASLLILDMSRFKAINDTYGHDVGDRALTRVAEGLDRCLRQTDSAYRLGGDEFALILPETPYHGARRLAARLIQWLRDNPIRETGGELVQLRANMGMAQWRQGENRDEWFRRADQALYRQGEERTARDRLSRLA